MKQTALTQIRRIIEAEKATDAAIPLRLMHVRLDQPGTIADLLVRIDADDDRTAHRALIAGLRAKQHAAEVGLECAGCQCQLDTAESVHSVTVLFDGSRASSPKVHWAWCDECCQLDPLHLISKATAAPPGFAALRAEGSRR
jgi:hypothetical protein